MNTASSLRDKLYDFIRVADDKKLSAIYNLLENVQDAKNYMIHHSEFYCKLILKAIYTSKQLTFL